MQSNIGECSIPSNSSTILFHTEETPVWQSPLLKTPLWETPLSRLSFEPAPKQPGSRAAWNTVGESAMWREFDIYHKKKKFHIGCLQSRHLKSFRYNEITLLLVIAGLILLMPTWTVLLQEKRMRHAVKDLRHSVNRAGGTPSRAERRVNEDVSSNKNAVLSCVIRIANLCSRIPACAGPIAGHDARNRLHI